MNTPQPAVIAPLGPRVRLAISAVLAFHLVAIVAAPMSVIPDTEAPPPDATEPPPGQLSHRVAMGLRWYVEPLYLNHGYRFFAPNPGPSDIIRCELEYADGRKEVQTYPDLRKQWPRLLYHRHFMLTSRLQPGGDSPAVLDYAQAYAQHLAERHQAQVVRIYHVRHMLAERRQVLRGQKLTDPSLYVVVPNPLPVGVWSTAVEVSKQTRAAAAEAPGGWSGEGGVFPVAVWSQGAPPDFIAPGPPEALIRPPEEVPAVPRQNLPGVLAPPGGALPLVVRNVRLVVHFNPKEQRMGRPLFGKATLTGLPAPESTLELNWQLEPADGLRLSAPDAGAPPMLGVRIGENALLLRVPLPDGREDLIVLERSEQPLAEFRREEP